MYANWKLIKKVREFYVWRRNASACVSITAALTSISQHKMQLARIPYLVCGASKLQLSHHLNKWNYIPSLKQRKKSFSSRFREDVIHNKTHRNWQWKWEFELESILLWNHWYYSELILPPVFGVWYDSHQIFACSFTSIELFSRQGRVTTSLLFSQFNYQKYQWRSSRCWNYYCEKHCLIKASWCVCKWKHPYEFGTVFEMVLEV